MDISIRVKGHLDPSWQSWLEDLQILHESDGTTMLTGTLPDQPALYGILNKLNHLSLTLLFLQSSEPMERGKSEYFYHDRLDRYKNEKKEQTERNTGKITTSFSMSLDGFAAGPEVALSEVEALAHDLEAYHLFHAIRGAFLLELGRREEAQAAEMQALTLTGNQAEQSLLCQRLSERGVAWGAEERKRKNTMKTVSVANKRPEAMEKRAATWLWAVVVLVSMAVFLDTVDVSIINVALPNLQRDLQLTMTDLQWVQGAYVLTNAGLQLLGGRAADLFGRRRIFLMGTSLFGLSSLICGLAYSGWLLILARGVQGIGAALMFPSAVSILTTTFAEGPERNKALGIFTATAGAGFSLGLVVGGLLTSFISWHWVFFVNVPIVVMIVVLALLIVPESRSASGRRSYDLAGAITVTAGLLLLVYAITQASNGGATLLKTAVLFFVALVLLASFILIEQRSTAPLVPLHIFRSSTLRSANVAFLTLLGSFFGFLFIFTLYLQDVLHYSPINASLALLPGSLVSILISRFVAPCLLNRVGMKLSCCLGLLCLMSGIALFVQIGAGSDYIGAILPTVILTQVGMGIGNTALSLAGVRGVKATEQGLAAGLQGAVGATGGGLGLAIVSAVVVAVTAASLHAANAGSVVTAQLSGLHAGLLTAAVGAALGALIALIGIRK